MLLSGSPTGALSGSLPEAVDVCVVGGGQSALALAFHLRRAERRRTGTPLTVVLLDARAQPGGAWQDAWPSLRLFSPAGYSSLPGRLMPRPPGDEPPDAAHVVDYLADYEQRYDVDVRRPVRVETVERAEDGLRVRTDHGTLRADVVVRATEAWTPRLPGLRRALAPVYSLVIATEPLPEATWERIGLRERETFSDHRHLIVYGQRTAEGRMVFGGRGAPYHLGSRVHPAHDRDPRVFARLLATLHEMFPVLRGVRVEHAWGGPLGIPRDWCASVGLDRRTGLAHAGGYVGDGLSTTNLAGRTLRDLVLGRDTELTRLPWVGHASPRWEPEPLRWLGINAGLRATVLADAEERLTGRPSLVARAVAPLLG